MGIAEAKQDAIAKKELEKEEYNFGWFLFFVGIELIKAVWWLVVGIATIHFIIKYW